MNSRWSQVVDYIGDGIIAGLDMIDDLRLWMEYPAFKALKQEAILAAELSECREVPITRAQLKSIQWHVMYIRELYCIDMFKKRYFLFNEGITLVVQD